ncbi:hypothetical protein [Streptomyces sp. NPDC057694]
MSELSPREEAIKRQRRRTVYERLAERGARGGLDRLKSDLEARRIA